MSNIIKIETNYHKLTAKKVNKMNCYNIILEYINSSPKGTPIFIEEIKEHIIKFYNENDKEKVCNNIKDILQV